MVTFTPAGANILKDIVKGDKTLVITADSNEQFAEFTQELTVILEKLCFINKGEPLSISQGNSFTLIVGQNTINGVAVHVSELFNYFGVTHILLDDTHRITKNNGCFYSAALGEPVVLDKVLNRYITNDGLQYTRAITESDSLYNISAKASRSFMTDFWKIQDSAKEASGITLEVGSTVRVKTYKELKEIFGESYLQLDTTTGKPVAVPCVTGEEPYRLINTIMLPESAGLHYCGMSGTIQAIHYQTGRVILDIDGDTVHNTFNINGKTIKQSSTSIDFYVSMLDTVN